MKKFRNILVVLVGISFIMSASGGLSSAQPIIPGKEIPSDIPAEVRKQIERLYSSESEERINGAEELGKMGEKAVPAIPFLIETLGDKTAHYTSMYVKSIRSVKSTVAEALGKIGEPAVQALITEVKDNKDLDARCNALWALGEIKDPRAVEPLIDVIKHDEDSTIREKAARALGAIKDPQAVETLINVLKNDEAANVREMAAWVLGETKDLRAVEPLMDALIEEELNVRRAAIGALGLIKDPGIFELMIAVIQHDKDFVVRVMAVRALGELKDPRAIEPLLIAVDDDDMYVRNEASDALESITGQGSGKSPAKWQRWWQENKEEFLK